MQATLKREYMNWDQLLTYPPPEPGEDTITVTRYDKGTYWVVPNPNDKEKVFEAEDLYWMDASSSVSKTTKIISKKCFDDPSVWNS